MKKFRPSVALISFQVLSSHTWPEATILHCAEYISITAESSSRQRCLEGNSVANACLHTPYWVKQRVSGPSVNVLNEIQINYIRAILMLAKIKK